MVTADARSEIGTETTSQRVVLDPYDYDFHEDPYPYYKRLRDEAPLYHNEEIGFWALSRHRDVLQGFRNSTTLSNRDGGNRFAGHVSRV